jgi:hypothetical protein
MWAYMNTFDGLEEIISLGAYHKELSKLQRLVSFLR